MTAYKIHYHSQAEFFSGAENMLANFLSSQDMRKQYEISFSYQYSVKYSEGFQRRVPQQNFPIHPLYFFDPSNVIFVPNGLPSLIKRGISFLSRLIFGLPILVHEIFILAQLLRRIKPKILHINNSGYPAALSARAAAVAARLAGVPHVLMVVNNLAVGYRRPSRWLNYPLDLLVARSVSKFITGSLVASGRLKEVLNLHESKCLTIHNGIALRQKTETPVETLKRLGLAEFKGVIFGVVAMLKPNKGHQVLLEAMLKLLNTQTEASPNIKILIEGDGPSRQSLHEFVARHKLNDHCVFVGHEMNVMNFIACLDVLVLPSVDLEDFPNVILEAMGLGKPVIASRLAGTPEQVVDGETGLLVEPRDVCQLADALKTLSLDPQRRSQMGQAGQQRFQQCFTSEVAVNNYNALYKSLMKEQK